MQNPPPRQLQPAPAQRHQLGANSRQGVWVVTPGPPVQSQIREAPVHTGPKRPISSQIGADRLSVYPFTKRVPQPSTLGG